MTYPDFNNGLGQARSAQQQKQYEEALKRHQEAMAKWMLDHQEQLRAEAMRRMYENLNFQNQARGQRQSTFNYAPQKPAIPDNHWSRVLGVSPSATVAEIKTAYRQKAKGAHSDAGGSDSEMSRLNVARDQAMKERGPK